ncbi:YbfB/YjiJ family MFS transporter [soil metagenome]
MLQQSRLDESAAAAPAPVLWVAAALALAAAVSLGLSRFSYALLLPPMRADLGWSYLTAGSMNTVNAAGYLAGALLLPWALRRFEARAVLLAGSAATSGLLVAHGWVVSDQALYALRFSTGIVCAATFVSGGLLATRLSGGPAPGGMPRGNTAAASAGLVLGVYYGGVGVGIIVSALLVPPLSALAAAHAWQWAWIGLGLAALAATMVTARATAGIDASFGGPVSHLRFAWRRFALGLAAYFLFGLGYIGYMTFVVTLLREQRLSDGSITAFYGLLGAAGVASSWLWAGVLQRFRGGQTMALLNALLTVATLLPALSARPLAVFASGALFGAVFLSVVAAATALVRHNLPAAGWSAGISAFTTVFAAGQIVGPSLVGWVADGAGGLRTGLLCSAGVLALSSLLAWMQKPLDRPAG